MKTKIQSRKYELILLAILSLLISFGIDHYYSSLMPDFDIGFNGAFTTLKCWAWILILWGIEFCIFQFVNKRLNKIRNIRFASVAVMIIYELMIWGFCYYQYIIQATQDWNDMINGNVG